LSESGADVVDRGALVRTQIRRARERERGRRVPIELGPVDAGLLEVLQPQAAYRHGLLPDRLLRVRTPLRRGRDHQAFGEPAPARGRQELVQIALGDPVRGRIELALDRCQPAIATLGDQIYPGVMPP